MITRPTHRPRRLGVTLVEVTVSMVVVSVMLVAALRSVSSAAMTQRVTADQITGRMLVDSLLDEIQRTAYEEPAANARFEREGDEPSDSRALWDDVDDFDGWIASPPQSPGGSVLPGLSGWTRRVDVAWVNPKDPRVASKRDTGLKRITVTALRGGAVRASGVLYRGVDGDPVAPLTVDAALGDAPVPVLLADVTTGAAPLTVKFDARSSTDSESKSLTYHWDFGDGSVSTSDKLDHIFTKPGCWVVTLTIRDDTGLAAMSNAMIDVSG